MTGYDVGYYQRDIAEYQFARYGLLRPDQLAAFCYVVGLPFFGNDQVPRARGPIASIGCGAGDLEVALERAGLAVDGVDPSPGAEALYGGSVLWPSLASAAPYGVLVFCESIEHIPETETRRLLSTLDQGARVVVVNWPDFHPIHPDHTGWDHVTLVDDAFFDRISEGFHVLSRRGSHLVMERA